MNQQPQNPEANASDPAPAPQEPTNPYRENTKMLIVADRLLSGETDQGKIARELGLSRKTVTSTASDLRKKGYIL